MTVLEKLLSFKKEGITGLIALLDPDKKSSFELAESAERLQSAGVDCFLIGSSIMLSDSFDASVRAIKKAVDVPVIIFPNGSGMLSPAADAVLFMSLISGRNPDLLIGEQVKAAPIVRTMKLEAIPTAYILIESGNLTSVVYLSNTVPIPRDKPEIAMAHALAAQYMGMKIVYLEAGSGATLPVHHNTVRQVVRYIDLPVMVGGGINDPAYANKLSEAGASFIVIGNVLETDCTGQLAQEFSQAVHSNNTKKSIFGA